MDSNPYQAPQATDEPEATAKEKVQRTRGNRLIGLACFYIALYLAVIGLTAPDDLSNHIVFWLAILEIAAAFAVMGCGMFMRRQRLPIAGLVMFAAPLVAGMIYRLMR